MDEVTMAEGGGGGGVEAGEVHTMADGSDHPETPLAFAARDLMR